MAGDWVKLHRCILDSEVFADDWLTRLFLWCLLRANFEQKTFRGETLMRGQFTTGKIIGAEALNVSPSKFYRGLFRLQELGCITIEANRERTMITVCNYSTYQDAKSASEPRADHERTTSEPQMNHERTANEPRADTIKERKNPRREEGKNERMEEKSNTPPSPPEGESPVGGDTAADASRTMLAVIQHEWNLNVAGAGFKQLRTISGARATAVRARLREPFWRDNWREGFEKLRSLTNLVGKCEFDWLVRPGNLEKVLEGQCDGWFSSTGPPAGPPMRSRFETVADRNQRVCDEMLKEIGYGPDDERTDDQVIDVTGRVVQPASDAGSDGGVLQCPF